MNCKLKNTQKYFVESMECLNKDAKKQIPYIAGRGDQIATSAVVMYKDSW